ncbi:MAG: TolC family protein, partial [Phycisphaeraceae bacterium]
GGTVIEHVTLSAPVEAVDGPAAGSTPVVPLDVDGNPALPGGTRAASTSTQRLDGDVWEAFDGQTSFGLPSTTAGLRVRAADTVEGPDGQTAGMGIEITRLGSLADEAGVIAVDVEGRFFGSSDDYISQYPLQSTEGDDYDPDSVPDSVLFDAGQRRAEVNRAEAVTRQRVAEYGQSVLTAFREVEDALAAEQFDAQRIDRLEEQLRLSRQTLEQLRTQYLNGVTDYIAVLTALTQQQRLQRDLVASRLARLDSRIELYRALAGPFDTPRERAANADSRTTDPRIDDSAAAEHDASTHEENPHE